VTKNALCKVLRKYTKLSESDIQFIAEVYPYPFAFFWMYYPQKAVTAAIRWIRKRWRKHD
jgi:hypothetical protein